MKRVLLILFILIIAACFGILLSYSPGYIFISIYHWSVETTLLTGAILTVLLYIVIKGFFLALHSLIFLPSEIKQTIVCRRKQKSKNLFHQGLQAYLKGDWNNTLPLMIKSLKEANKPLVNYIILIDAANRIGNFTERDNLINQAIYKLPAEKNALQLFHARLCIDSEQWKYALEILCPLWKINLDPSVQPSILKYLVKVYEKESNWLELIALLTKIRQYRIFSKIELNQFTESIYINAFTTLLNNNAQSTEIDAFILTVPKYIKKSDNWTVEYTKYLSQEKNMQTAENLKKGYFIN